MITDARWFQKEDGTKVLQVLGPGKTVDVDAEGFLRFSFQDMEWQDVPLVLENNVIHLGIAS